MKVKITTTVLYLLHVSQRNTIWAKNWWSSKSNCSLCVSLYGCDVICVSELGLRRSCPSFDLEFRLGWTLCCILRCPMLFLKVSKTGDWWFSSSSSSCSFEWMGAGLVQQNPTIQAGPSLTNQTSREGNKSADTLPTESNAALIYSHTQQRNSTEQSMSYPQQI